MAKGSTASLSPASSKLSSRPNVPGPISSADWAWVSRSAGAWLNCMVAPLPPTAKVEAREPRSRFGFRYCRRRPPACRSHLPRPSCCCRAATPRPLRILLVEDHADSARIMARLLSSDGHTVQSAADVATAMKVATEQTFDLLLSDLGLPDGTGLDLLRALRAQGIRLPAIALSGYGQESDVRASRKAGFAVHLTKPLVLRRLQQAIADVTALRDNTD